MLTAWQVIAMLSGDTEAITTAIALAVLTVIGAFALAAFAVAVPRGASWGRSGGIVAQLLILAVALGAATGEFAHPLVAVGIALPALVTFIALVLVAWRAGRGRDAASL
nr:histidine kinase [Microbacterium endophyticum]